MKVTYSSSTEDTWRCNVICILFSWEMSVMALNAAMVAAFLGWWLKLTVVEAVSFWAVCYGIYLCWVVVALSSVARRAKSLPKRYVTTELNPDGIQVIAPEAAAFTKWSNLRGVAFRAGDVYFLKRGSSTTYVPRSAFSDLNQAQRFYDAAKAARAGDYSKTYEPLGDSPEQRPAVEVSHAGMSPRNQRSPSRAPRTIAFGMIILSLAAIGYGIYGTIRSHALIGEYAQSPGCTRDAPASMNRSPCTFTNIVVVGKQYEYHKSGDTYYLQLGDNPNTVVVRVDEPLSRAVEIGGTVAATWWRGKITVVSAKGITSQTADNPASLRLTAFTSIWQGIAGVGLGFVLLLAIRPTVNGNKKSSAR